VLNESARRKSQREREALREEHEAMKREARQVVDVVDLIRTLTHAALIAAGYHTHKGQWRKRREQSS
jgi:hypothetical protein